MKYLIFLSLLFSFSSYSTIQSTNGEYIEGVKAFLRTGKPSITTSYKKFVVPLNGIDLGTLSGLILTFLNKNLKKLPVTIRNSLILREDYKLTPHLEFNSSGFFVDGKVPSIGRYYPTTQGTMKTNMISATKLLKYKFIQYHTDVKYQRNQNSLILCLDSGNWIEISKNTSVNKCVIGFSEYESQIHPFRIESSLNSICSSLISEGYSCSLGYKPKNKTSDFPFTVTKIDEKKFKKYSVPSYTRFKWNDYDVNKTDNSTKNRKKRATTPNCGTPIIGVVCIALFGDHCQSDSEIKGLKTALNDVKNTLNDQQTEIDDVRKLQNSIHHEVNLNHELLKATTSALYSEKTFVEDFKKRTISEFKSIQRNFNKIVAKLNDAIPSIENHINVVESSLKMDIEMIGVMSVITSHLEFLARNPLLIEIFGVLEVIDTKGKESLNIYIFDLIRSSKGEELGEIVNCGFLGRCFKDFKKIPDAACIYNKKTGLVMYSDECSYVDTYYLCSQKLTKTPKYVSTSKCTSYYVNGVLYTPRATEIVSFNGTKLKISARSIYREHCSVKVSNTSVCRDYGEIKMHQFSYPDFSFQLLVNNLKSADQELALTMPEVTGHFKPSDKIEEEVERKFNHLHKVEHNTTLKYEEEETHYEQDEAHFNQSRSKERKDIRKLAKDIEKVSAHSVVSGTRVIAIIALIFSLLDFVGVCIILVLILKMKPASSLSETKAVTSLFCGGSASAECGDYSTLLLLFTTIIMSIPFFYMIYKLSFRSRSFFLSRTFANGGISMRKALLKASSIVASSSVAVGSSVGIVTCYDCAKHEALRSALMACLSLMTVVGWVIRIGNSRANDKYGPESVTQSMMLLSRAQITIAGDVVGLQLISSMNVEEYFAVFLFLFALTFQDDAPFITVLIILVSSISSVVMMKLTDSEFGWNFLIIVNSSLLLTSFILLTKKIYKMYKKKRKVIKKGVDYMRVIEENTQRRNEMQIWERNLPLNRDIEALEDSRLRRHLEIYENDKRKYKKLKGKTWLSFGNTILVLIFLIALFGFRSASATFDNDRIEDFTQKGFSEYRDFLVFPGRSGGNIDTLLSELISRRDPTSSTPMCHSFFHGYHFDVTKDWAAYKRTSVVHYKIPFPTGFEPHLYKNANRYASVVTVCFGTYMRERSFRTLGYLYPKKLFIQPSNTLGSGISEVKKYSDVCDPPGKTATVFFIQSSRYRWGRPRYRYSRIEKIIESELYVMNMTKWRSDCVSTFIYRNNYRSRLGMSIYLTKDIVINNCFKIRELSKDVSVTFDLITNKQNQINKVYVILKEKEANSKSLRRKRSSSRCYNSINFFSMKEKILREVSHMFPYYKTLGYHSVGNLILEANGVVCKNFKNKFVILTVNSERVWSPGCILLVLFFKEKTCDSNKVVLKSCESQTEINVYRPSYNFGTRLKRKSVNYIKSSSITKEIFKSNSLPYSYNYQVLNQKNPKRLKRSIEEGEVYNKSFFHGLSLNESLRVNHTFNVKLINVTGNGGNDQYKNINSSFSTFYNMDLNITIRFNSSMSSSNKHLPNAPKKYVYSGTYADTYTQPWYPDFLQVQTLGPNKERTFDIRRLFQEKGVRYWEKERCVLLAGCDDGVKNQYYDCTAAFTLGQLRNDFLKSYPNDFYSRMPENRVSYFDWNKPRAKFDNLVGRNYFQMGIICNAAYSDFSNEDVCNWKTFFNYCTGPTMNSCKQVNVGKYIGGCFAPTDVFVAAFFGQQTFSQYWTLDRFPGFRNLYSSPTRLFSKFWYYNFLKFREVCIKKIMKRDMNYWRKNCSGEVQKEFDLYTKLGVKFGKMNYRVLENCINFVNFEHSYKVKTNFVVESFSNDVYYTVKTLVDDSRYKKIFNRKRRTIYYESNEIDIWDNGLITTNLIQSCYELHKAKLFVENLSMRLKINNFNPRSFKVTYRIEKAPVDSLVFEYNNGWKEIAAKITTDKKCIVLYKHIGCEGKIIRYCKELVNVSHPVQIISFEHKVVSIKLLRKGKQTKSDQEITKEEFDLTNDEKKEEIKKDIKKDKDLKDLQLLIGKGNETVKKYTQYKAQILMRNDLENKEKKKIQREGKKEIKENDNDLELNNQDPEKKEENSAIVNTLFFISFDFFLPFLIGMYYCISIEPDFFGIVIAIITQLLSIYCVQITSLAFSYLLIAIDGFTMSLFLIGVFILFRLRTKYHKEHKQIVVEYKVNNSQIEELLKIIEKSLKCIQDKKELDESWDLERNFIFCPTTGKITVLSPEESKKLSNEEKEKRTIFDGSFESENSTCSECEEWDSDQSYASDVFENYEEHLREKHSGFSGKKSHKERTKREKIEIERSKVRNEGFILMDKLKEKEVEGQTYNPHVDFFADPDYVEYENFLRNTENSFFRANVEIAHDKMKQKRVKRGEILKAKKELQTKINEVSNSLLFVVVVAIIMIAFFFLAKIPLKVVQIQERNEFPILTTSRASPQMRKLMLFEPVTKTPKTEKTTEKSKITKNENKLLKMLKLIDHKKHENYDKNGWYKHVYVHSDSYGVAGFWIFLICWVAFIVLKVIEQKMLKRKLVQILNVSQSTSTDFNITGEALQDIGTKSYLKMEIMTGRFVNGEYQREKISVIFAIVPSCEIAKELIRSEVSVIHNESYTAIQIHPHIGKMKSEAKITGKKSITNVFKLPETIHQKIDRIYAAFLLVDKKVILHAGIKDNARFVEVKDPLSFLSGINKKKFEKISVTNEDDFSTQVDMEEYHKLTELNEETLERAHRNRNSQRGVRRPHFSDDNISENRDSEIH